MDPLQANPELLALYEHARKARLTGPKSVGIKAEGRAPLMLSQEADYGRGAHPFPGDAQWAAQPSPPSVVPPSIRSMLGKGTGDTRGWALDLRELRSPQATSLLVAKGFRLAATSPNGERLYVKGGSIHPGEFGQEVIFHADGSIRVRSQAGLTDHVADIDRTGNFRPARASWVEPFPATESRVVRPGASEDRFAKTSPIDRAARQPPQIDPAKILRGGLPHVTRLPEGGYQTEGLILAYSIPDYDEQAQAMTAVAEREIQRMEGERLRLAQETFSTLR